MVSFVFVLRTFSPVLTRPVFVSRLLVYWMFVGALFRDSASRVLKHYRHYVEQIEAEANELAKKQVEEEENKLYYLEHKEQLEEEYELLRAMNASRTNKVLMDDYDGVKTLIKTWSTGGAQEPMDNATLAKQLYERMRHWRWPTDEEERGQSNPASPSYKKGSLSNPNNRKHLDIDYNRSSKLPLHHVRKLLTMAKERIPMLQELDPEVAAERAAERELKRYAKAKEKALKEAAKVVVDYRPVMSRIIDDYLFRCPSWHLAHKISRNRVENADEESDNTHQDNHRTEDHSRHKAASSGRNSKLKYKRSRNNNNIYVYRFSQPTHIPGYKECWGKSCHTAELPYVFQAMDIIRSHYSTLSPFAQDEAPVSPEYPYTDILTAYQGALDEMEEHQYDDADEDEDLWNENRGSSSGEYPGRGGGQPGDDGHPAVSPLESLLTDQQSSARSAQQPAHQSNNATGSKAFQRLLKNMFGDYFMQDADEDIAADMAERWYVIFMYTILYID
jgi:hypothetical protein